MTSMGLRAFMSQLVLTENMILQWIRQ